MHHSPTTRPGEFGYRRKAVFTGEYIEVINRVGHEGNARESRGFGTMRDMDETVIVGAPHVQRVFVTCRQLQTEAGCEFLHCIKIGCIEPHERDVSNFYGHEIPSIVAWWNSPSSVGTQNTENSMNSVLADPKSLANTDCSSDVAIRVLLRLELKWLWRQRTSTCGRGAYPWTATGLVSTFV
jgi:hypothetical protein